MVAFNFVPMFRPKIFFGTKLSTIRQTQRCKVGDVMQLYVGQRTKNCEKLLDVVCCGVGTAEFSERWGMQIQPIAGNIRPSDAPFYEQEGFESIIEFEKFFETRYRLPFHGFVHAWRFPC